MTELLGHDVIGRLAPTGYDSDELQLLPDEAALVGSAVPKRRREFAVGRSLARGLLAEIGIPPAPLLRDADRCPIWPEQVVGSISHSSELCAVVVTRSDRPRGVGIDVESDQPLEKKLRDRICLAAEIDGLDEDAAGLRGKLLFSIKEAIYKCQFPISRTRLDFHDVEVELDLERQRFCGAMRVASAASLTAALIHGGYTWQAGHVFCVAELPV